MGYANTKYKTEKRKANVGERILITNAHITLGDYKDGEVFTVKGYFTDEAVMTTKRGLPCILHREYEVIVEAKPSKSERISLLESQVAELQAQVEALQKADNPRPSSITITADGINITGPSMTFAKASKPTPNEQRKAVIKRANAFVAKHLNIGDEVVIAENLRKVTVIVGAWTTFPVGLVRVGVSKCAPDDVFNADIGKAIALGRALGLDVSEFENAPKPTEVVVGMRVLYAVDKKRGVMTVISDDRGSNYPANETKLSLAKTLTSVIIDDTEAQY